MSIRVAVHHETRYTYDRPVDFSPHVVQLRPAPHCRTPIISYSLKIEPSSHFINWQQDPFGNYQARIVFQKPALELRVEVDLIADMTVINPFDFFLEKEVEVFPFTYGPALARDLAPYLHAAPCGPRLAEFIEMARARMMLRGRRSVDVLVDLNRHLQKTVRYDVRMEPGVFEPDETLERGHGSCRDFAWLLVCALRQFGFAARFVSGYSIQLRPDEKPLQGPAGVEHDMVDLHAWAEVFLPGAGWVGLDATSGLLAGEGHIPMACTPHPQTAAAITGTYGWHKREESDRIAEAFSFSMDVKRVYESPRVTMPYTEQAWKAIDALGADVDRHLAAEDVRLTMGGEPTFVAADDPEAPEWTVAALGPTKRRYASQLVARLHERFAPRGLIHEGQGKWYPGEPLPRWALSVYFRNDGLPIWRDPALFAQSETGTATHVDASKFATQLARRLGVDPSFAQAAYEDAWYYLWRERRLPVNTDPHNSRLEDELERARLARVFEAGLKAIVGYALPLRELPGAAEGAVAWQSAPWLLRRERMCLLPGDSPMGYRLPLDSLPWAETGDVPGLLVADPFAERRPLPSRERLVAEVQDRAVSPQAAQRPPDRLQSDSSVVRTALCVEPRGGVLHVFLPPLQSIEACLVLWAAIEATAEEQGVAVRLEGYPPPPDPRIGHFQVTPDPGVIEVNVHPATNWRDLERNTSILYEEAHRVGLRSEKFMLDGRHTGTGGGNHVVLGGPTPADSPLLRRPDLLKSLVGYWLNHPSLSFLFSGLFVGPTSQSPRVDEARNDSLYELEIAFQQLSARAEASGTLPPWLIDRSLRNLLIDDTGNTHRTEFCIDKLYSPEGIAGRRGLVELRSFEMPPHPRMSLTQQLLVRALVGWFWRQPYDRPPIDWGTELHDRFMLPHFVHEDFEEVLDDLRRGGFDFDPAWFTPHYEFRFPLLGRVEGRGGVTLELRQAIEPWHVLGEETSASGTSRYVDSSVERIEVKASGIVEGRHAVACNGRRLPLAPTGTIG
ncbi:MAG TPA: transglutaminase family protein, partial [Polyangiaceae bacterium]|nr:transglutaminase family protein [Polyangiaceae bacterium]